MRKRERERYRGARKSPLSLSLFERAAEKDRHDGRERKR